MTKVVIFLSAPAASAEAALRSLLAQHGADRPVIYVRDRDKGALAGLLANHDVRSDKPLGGRMGFVRQLRADPADLVIALWLGHDEYWPAKTLFLLARGRQKLAITEREAAPLDTRSIGSVLGHAIWRQRNRVPSPYGRGGLLSAAARGIYRATLGRILGVGITVVRYVTGF